MRTSLFSTALAGLTPFGAAGDTFPPFEIARTWLVEMANGNTTLLFTVHDPSKLTNATQECLGSWKTDSSDYPSSVYQPCSGNGAFAWRLDSFTGSNDFVIGLEHSFEDDEMGPYPYDYVDNYGSATFNSSNLYCENFDGNVTCGQVPGRFVKAPITRTAAK
ncbi:hypothetical protein EJ03DRAFT_94585 [Teratosphaeria nubilosa]|uniref:AA1-like domain-containing protein n=1 Tax=Teratosphaeria nubilosa TaxID=161662 RepID=A0A6G1L8T4_9PEZI|nr:hypothetical protein EJ03DRAFT_94585 [Teratosphaeria nubilosa]